MREMLKVYVVAMVVRVVGLNSISDLIGLLSTNGRKKHGFTHLQLNPDTYYAVAGRPL